MVSRLNRKSLKASIPSAKLGKLTNRWLLRKQPSPSCL